MGDKYAVRHHHGSTPRSKLLTLTKSKLKLVIFCSLVLVFLIWNSAPFGGGAGSRAGAVPADHEQEPEQEQEQGKSLVVREAELFGAYARQHKGKSRFQDGRSEGVGLLAPPHDDEPVRKARESEAAKESEDDEQDRTDMGSRDEEERETLKLSDKPNGELALEDEETRPALRSQIPAEPKSLDDEPKSLDDEPKSQAEEPKSQAEKPKSQAEKPKSQEVEPKSQDEEPKAQDEESKSLEEEPKAQDEEPQAEEEVTKAPEEEELQAEEEETKAPGEVAKAPEEEKTKAPEELQAAEEGEAKAPEELQEPGGESKASEEPERPTREDRDAEQVARQRGQTLEQGGRGDEREGDLNSTANVLRMQLFEEMRAQSLPYEAVRSARDENASCDGKYVFVYELPAEFNADLAARCASLFPSFDLCDYLADAGIGKPVDTRDNGSQILVPAARWYNTHQYALELVSHARIRRYRCLTTDPERAALFYIPFYGGLDVIRWNFAADATNADRDALSLRLLEWLRAQPAWARRGGRDHVLVLGKISWDFRRQAEGGVWGSRLLEMADTQQLTSVLIERNPWARNDVGVPHPTFFHPRSARDVRTWLAHVAAQARGSLVTFVGKERPGTGNVRGELVRQCRADAAACRFVECERNLCQAPAFVTRAFLGAHFCMQPVGDSPTRRSVFDSLIAGCIPVLFHPCTAFVQYPWHLPPDRDSWSVYISEDAVKRGDADVIATLRRIPHARRAAMRATIIDHIIPGLLYSAPGSDIAPFRDAFDITLDQLLHRVASLDRRTQL